MRSPVPGPVRSSRTCSRSSEPSGGTGWRRPSRTHPHRTQVLSETSGVRLPRVAQVALRPAIARVCRRLVKRADRLGEDPVGRRPRNHRGSRCRPSCLRHRHVNARGPHRKSRRAVGPHLETPSTRSAVCPRAMYVPTAALAGRLLLAGRASGVGRGWSRARVTRTAPPSMATAPCSPRMDRGRLDKDRCMLVAVSEDRFEAVLRSVRRAGALNFACAQARERSVPEQPSSGSNPKRRAPHLRCWLGPRIQRKERHVRAVPTDSLVRVSCLLGPAVDLRVSRRTGTRLRRMPDMPRYRRARHVVGRGRGTAPSEDEQADEAISRPAVTGRSRLPCAMIRTPTDTTNVSAHSRELPAVSSTPCRPKPATAFSTSTAQPCSRRWRWSTGFIRVASLHRCVGGDARENGQDVSRTHPGRSSSCRSPTCWRCPSPRRRARSRGHRRPAEPQPHRYPLPGDRHLRHRAGTPGGERAAPRRRRTGPLDVWEEHGHRHVDRPGT